MYCTMINLNSSPTSTLSNYTNICIIDQYMKSNKCSFCFLFKYEIHFLYTFLLYVD